MSPAAITPRAAPADSGIASPPEVWSRGRGARPTPAPQPLNEALPRVDSILIDRDRRLAIIGGTILEVGASVGSRSIVQIERDAVILREPSGLEIRVRLRSFGSGGAI
jgi:hypothetical protein